MNMKSSEYIKTEFSPVERIIEGITLVGLRRVLSKMGLAYQISEDREENQWSSAYPYADTVLKRLSYKNSSNEDENSKVVATIERFRDQIFLDLGAGMDTWGRQIAEMGQAKAYVAIEPKFYIGLEPSLRKPSSMKTCIVAERMLSFLKRLPANSVSIWMSGTDRNILRNAEYVQQTAQEVARVLHPEGVYAFCNSNVQLRDRNGRLFPNIKIGPSGITNTIDFGSYIKTN